VCYLGHPDVFSFGISVSNFDKWISRHVKQPLSTHAEESLIGSCIQQNLVFDGKRANVWVPSKDTGVDLLVTDRNKQKHSEQMKVCS